METKLTAVQWLYQRLQTEPYLTLKDFEQALAMEKEQHGETWDAAIKGYRDRGHNVVMAIVDFDEYWGKINIPISEDVGQPGLPEGGN